jgi:hypothetical protein
MKNLIFILFIALVVPLFAQTLIDPEIEIYLNISCKLSENEIIEEEKRVVLILLNETEPTNPKCCMREQLVETCVEYNYEAKGLGNYNNTLAMVDQPQNRYNRAGLIIGIVSAVIAGLIGVAVLTIAIFAAVFYIWANKKKKFYSVYDNRDDSNRYSDLVKELENDSNTTPLLDEDHMSDMHQPIISERAGLLETEEYTRYDPSEQFEQMGAYSDYQSMGSMEQPDSQLSLSQDLQQTTFSQDGFEVPQTSFSQDGFEQDDFENDNYDE